MDRDIYLKKYEVESLLKSFFIFFTLQLILLAVIMLQSYHQGRHAIDDEIRNQMKICSFDLKCEGLQLDFVPKTARTKPRKLYKEGDIYSFFEVPTVGDYLLKVILPQKAYQKRVSALKKRITESFLLYALLIALLSFLFSLYALRPLREALRLNEEFVKDILHDINTPLSAMVVNFKLFQKEIGQNRKIERMQSSISTILSLQNNLKAFLDNTPLQRERFALRPLLQDRIAYFQTLYPHISFLCDVDECTLETNRDAVVRIVDNLLGNACKYNSRDGSVEVVLEDYRLLIRDNGKGIENVKKVFRRFYRESDRGIGIGLHIVKKLCDELGIGIRIESTREVGTIVVLDIGKVIIK